MPISQFKNEITKLHLSGYSIDVERITRNNISALNIIITLTETQPHRTFSDIKKIITQSTLSDTIQQKSIDIFTRLAQAESTIHHQPISSVHFHEVGAIDSIIDIIGTVILLDYYKISKIISSALPLGTGFVDCAHGKLPVPAPATVELLKNIPVYQTNRKQELVTPTGAAIITTLSETYGPMPPMKISQIGYGAGKTISKHPNLLRIYLGTPNQIKKNKL
jgi:uncharacterized protein (TIGR00299 family) protein